MAKTLMYTFTILVPFVDGHIGYCLFCSNLSEQREYMQLCIHQRLKWNLTCLYFND